MVLYKRKEIRFIVSIAVLLFFPLFCNAAATEEPEEEILFITHTILTLNIPTITSAHL